jgi:hypothetical protein
MGYLRHRRQGTSGCGATQGKLFASNQQSDLRPLAAGRSRPKRKVATMRVKRSVVLAALGLVLVSIVVAVLADSYTAYLPFTTRMPIPTPTRPPGHTLEVQVFFDCNGSAEWDVACRPDKPNMKMAPDRFIPENPAVQVDIETNKHQWGNICAMEPPPTGLPLVLTSMVQVQRV